MTYDIPRRETPKTAIIRVVGATALAIALLLGLWAGLKPASAQSVCMTHAEMMKQLDGRFSESQVAIGLASNGQLLEVFSTGDGSTWTIVITKPDGMSCVLTTGEAWDGRKQIALGQPA